MIPKETFIIFKFTIQAYNMIIIVEMFIKKKKLNLDQHYQ